MRAPQAARLTARLAGRQAAGGSSGGPGVPVLLLPAGGRQPAAIVAACCAAITVALAILVARTAGPGLLDRSADSGLVTHLGPHAPALTWVMDLGETVQVTSAH